jgi:hypothetical protein
MQRPARLSLPALTLGALALVAPALAQDIEVRCEVYRFAERSQALDERGVLQVAAIRKQGRLRYQARIPLRIGNRAEASSKRRIAFETKTASQGVVQTSVQFLHVGDSLSVEARPSRVKTPGSVSLHLDLGDVVQGQDRAGLPVVHQRQVRTIVGLDYGRDVIVVQSGGAGSEPVQVVILRVVMPKPVLVPKPVQKTPPGPR